MIWNEFYCPKNKLSEVNKIDIKNRQKFELFMNFHFIFSIDATAETGRYGRLVNHSRKTPNLLPTVIMNGESPRLLLIAKRDIEPGVELLYDYGDRSKESLELHPWLAK